MCSFISENDTVNGKPQILNSFLGSNLVALATWKNYFQNAQRS